MIKFDNVMKVYDTKTALDSVNFTIKPGEVLGLLGHNGAGKSTAIKLLMGVIAPTSGQVTIYGETILSNPVEIKKKIGYVSDSPDVFLKFKPSEYWGLIQVAYGIDEAEYHKRLDYFVQLFNLTGREEELIESFSHGMRQKVFLIGALLPHPKVLVLDEPMTGLDPQAAYDLKQIMRKQAEEGNIVLFSTHVLEVAQELCDHIVILRQGYVIYDGTLAALQDQNNQASLEEIYLSLSGRGADGIENRTKSGEANDA